MIKYKYDFIATIILVITTIFCFVFKYLDVFPIVRILSLLMIASFSLILFFQTMPSIENLNRIIEHKPDGLDKNTKLKIYAKALKRLYAPLTKRQFSITVVILSLFYCYVFYLNLVNKFNEDAYSILLDFISAVALCSGFIQMHINFTIVKHLNIH